jgi:hypothetical protein
VLPYTLPRYRNNLYSNSFTRYDEGLWDPQGKPPSGRVKSAPPLKSNLPPRFQRRLGEEPARRLDSENSVVSDWSQEVEEEEERRSLNGASPFHTDDHHLQQAQQQSFRASTPPSGPGILRLSAAPVDCAPMPPPHPAWRSMEPENWRQQQQQAVGSWGYNTLPQSHMQNPPQRHLYDPNSGARPAVQDRGSWSDRQTSPDYPGPPFPNARIPMTTSRQVFFAEKKKAYPAYRASYGFGWRCVIYYHCSFFGAYLELVTNTIVLLT